MKQEIINRINQLTSQDEPFLFVINYQGEEAFIRLLSDIDPSECLFDFEGRSNQKEAFPQEISQGNEDGKASLPQPVFWEIEPPRFEDYERSFGIVKSNIMAGNSFLTNLTSKVPVRCHLSLEDIFHRTKGKYKLLLRRKSHQVDLAGDCSQNQDGQNQENLKEENLKRENQKEENQQGENQKKENLNKENQQGENQQGENPHSFVCFSPETFVRIKGGRIYSYPMKGTLDASLPDAEKQLMEDEKEAAEHATIVDLIRNDLSRVAEDVRVDKYRYIDVLHTNKGDILQTSSEISGRLPEDYRNHLGEILAAQLPAGSITGAPKAKTMQIIHEAEGYDRGFYTGIMGIYDQGELNSAVMIRFIEEEEEDEDRKYFKAGGGITSKSDCRKEYEEVIQKIYLPL